MGVSWARRRRPPAALALDGNAVAIAKNGTAPSRKSSLEMAAKKGSYRFESFGEFLTVNQAGFQTDADKTQEAE